jgi:hypothetical protein
MIGSTKPKVTGSNPVGRAEETGRKPHGQAVSCTRAPPRRSCTARTGPPGPARPVTRSGSDASAIVPPRTRMISRACSSLRRRCAGVSVERFAARRFRCGCQSVLSSPAQERPPPCANRAQARRRLRGRDRVRGQGGTPHRKAGSPAQADRQLDRRPCNHESLGSSGGGPPGGRGRPQGINPGIKVSATRRKYTRLNPLEQAVSHLYQPVSAIS